MGIEKDKLFKDPVHGYIAVPSQFCDLFVDTLVFQRLRHIEQTSMRPLYPAAHHDRFIHSLGVYHLGKTAFNHLVSGTDVQLLSPEWIPRLQKTFEIACLLHDCGHAPFSHTFEHFYNHSDTDGSEKRANSALLEMVDEPFRNDFNQLVADPAPHEVFSALVLLKQYSEPIREKTGGDPLLAARMITGCPHDNPSGNLLHQVENRLISLLNGDAIDVDKLDYIVRDTWASGVKNASIDVDRLLSAIMLTEDSGSVRLCYHKSAMSVLQTVVDARNYLYQWIYNHHTVLYYAELLELALRKLAKSFSKIENPDYFWDAIFSYKPFETPISLDDHHRLFLPSDGDIFQLLKTKAQDYPEVMEILSHKPSRYALWKTQAEFQCIFNNAKVKRKDMPNIFRNAPQALSDLTEGALQKDDVLIIQAHIKQAVIEPSDILILMDDDKGDNHSISKLVSYTDLFNNSQDDSKRDPKRFYYVFVPIEFRDKRKLFIEHLCKLSP